MAAARRGRKQKSSPASALEASLEMLYEVSTSLNKKKKHEKKVTLFIRLMAQVREVRQNMDIDLLLIELVAGAQNVI